MTALIHAIEGTPAGQQVAIALALAAAILHAVFGALQKGTRHDPWLSRAAIDACYGLIALPFALFVVPAPTPLLWLILAGAFVIHSGYKVLLAMAFSRGAYTVVYPVMRGTGPLFTVLGAGLFFDEHFTATQWAGLAVLLAGIYGLALYNLRHVTVARDTLVAALALAVATGGMVALYTTYDAWGIRTADDPFTFLVWFFVVDAVFMPAREARRLVAQPRAEALALIRLGAVGAVIGIASFGGVMLATRLGQVGQAAVLRETSTVFAALIGRLMLDERVGPRRFGLMALIAGGAIIVQLGA